MTKSLPLSTLSAQLEALCENPQELILTEAGEPVFTLLPYEMYQSLIETLDIVADGEALTTLQENLAELKVGKPVKIHTLTHCQGTHTVGLTDTAFQTLHSMDEECIHELNKSIMNLAQEPQLQGKALVGSLKGYRSIKAKGERYQIIYFINKTQVVVVFVHCAIIQPNALLMHLLKNS